MNIKFNDNENQATIIVAYDDLVRVQAAFNSYADRLEAAGSAQQVKEARDAMFNIADKFDQLDKAIEDHLNHMANNVTTKTPTIQEIIMQKLIENNCKSVIKEGKVLLTHLYGKKLSKVTTYKAIEVTSLLAMNNFNCDTSINQSGYYDIFITAIKEN